MLLDWMQYIPCFNHRKETQQREWGDRYGRNESINHGAWKQLHETPGSIIIYTSFQLLLFSFPSLLQVNLVIFVKSSLLSLKPIIYDMI